MNKKQFLGLAIILFLAFVIRQSLLTDNFLKWRYNEKIWVHRVNSTEKLADTYDLFSGFEIDVVFDASHGFDVTHPPVPSIGLELEQLLATQHPYKKYWLDFKNLQANNYKASLQRLQSIVKALGMQPHQMIVESTRPEFLIGFQKAGFQTAYYLPTGLFRVSDQERRAALTLIRSEMQNSNADFISADYRNYSILKEEFPKKEKLLWVLDAKRWTSNIKRRLQKYTIASDPTVKQLLVSYDVPVGDR